MHGMWAHGCEPNKEEAKGDAAVLGYDGEGICGVSYLGSGHELETYIHTYFIIFPERAFQRQYAWDVSTWCEPNKEEAEGKQ